MGGPPVNVKYIIIARFEVDGIAEKSDIIGAIFGQTEGLLGDELDLRELQKVGKLGRIDVDYDVKGGKTYGTIVVPTNLDKPEVALIAASLEIIDKVGPNSAKIEVKEIKDAREEKRKKILERAKEILIKWKESRNIDSEQLVQELIESYKSAQVVKYGPEQLDAGPDIDSSNEIIVVEGRADVVNMLKHGYRNVIALNGSKVPQTIVNLSKNKKVTLFVDGDRAGDLIIKEVINVAKVDYIARAPFGKEVEELSGKEIANALADKIPINDYLQKVKVEKKIEKAQLINDLVRSVIGTMEAIILDDNYNIIDRFPLKDIIERLTKIEKASTLILDGIITQRVLDISTEKGINNIYGYKIGNITSIPPSINVYLFDEQGMITKYEVRT
jgi:DNA primase (bacterial type)